MWSSSSSGFGDGKGSQDDAFWYLEQHSTTRAHFHVRPIPQGLLPRTLPISADIRVPTVIFRHSLRGKLPRTISWRLRLGFEDGA